MAELYKIALISEVKPEKIISFYRLYGSKTQRRIEEKILDGKSKYKCVGAVAMTIDGEEIVAAYLAAPQRLIANPGLNGVQSMDTLVAPAHRGQYLVEKMARVLYAAIERQGYDCVFGVPNALIEHLRYSKLGWNPASQLFRFTFWLPALLRYLVSVFARKQISAISRGISDTDSMNRWKRVLNDVELEYVIRAEKAGLEVLHTANTFAIARKNEKRCELGMLRCNAKTSLRQRLVFLCCLLVLTKTSLAISYASENSGTGKFLRLPILKTKGSRFGGRLLGDLRRASFGESSFEYIEFDTWGYSG